jgi:NAD(P)-dependent dehydrogenase (short-subunit alcohol dehydrogenase family)
MQIVVTGASRGIGLELVRQYLGRGDAVVAACRSPDGATALHALGREYGDRLRVLACDVGDDDSVAAFAAALEGTAVDLLINNAGVGDWAGLDAVNTADALRVYNVNALGPLRVTRALRPHLRAGIGRKVAHVTSGMGSIGDNSSGGAYAYRMSKAALNMASKSLAIDLADDGIVSVVINPGWVQTDMGGAGAPLTVQDSAEGMMARFDELTLAHTGAFLNWRGGEYAW